MPALLRPSLGHALRASHRLFKFDPVEFVAGTTNLFRTAVRIHADDEVWDVGCYNVTPATKSSGTIENNRWLARRAKVRKP